MKNVLGAIVGDVCGSIYEWQNAECKEDIVLFRKGSRFTDDTVCTCAVMKWLMDLEYGMTDEEKLKILCDRMHEICKKHPNAGYGGFFHTWIFEDEKEPYNSYGNGSGMRVSPCAFINTDLSETVSLAKLSSDVTHNHEEGEKGAIAIATCMNMAMRGATKVQIKNYIQNIYGYRLDKTVDEIRNSHPFDATCQVTVPEAIIAFLEGENFEDVIKKAIYIGGDSDTIAAMAGGIAGVYYGIPQWIIDKTISLLPEDLRKIVIDFEEYVNKLDNNYVN